MNKEEVKKSVLSFLFNNKIDILIGALVMLLSFTIYYLFKNGVSKFNDKPLPIELDSKYFLNVESDTGRLGCVFEQRRCYHENLGLEKAGVITRCGELNFCDEKFKLKK